MLKRVGVTGVMRRGLAHEYPPAKGSKTHGPRREGAGASCAEGLRLQRMGMTTGRAKVQTDPSCLRKAMVSSKPCWVSNKPVVAPSVKKMSALQVATCEPIRISLTTHQVLHAEIGATHRSFGQRSGTHYRSTRVK